MLNMLSTWLVGAGFLTALLVAGQRAPAQSPVAGGRYRGAGSFNKVVRYLSVPFHLRGGRLAIGPWWAVFSREAGLRVFLASPTRQIRIDRLTDLRGHVSIQSRQDAVA